MPTLTEILDAPARNGVYRLTPAAAGTSSEAANLLAAALSDRADILRLDARRYHDKDALLEAIGQILHFPDYYGMNWDALEECLLDLSWWAGPVIVLIEHADALERGTLTTLVDIWNQAAVAWAEAGRICVLLLADADTAASLPAVDV
jgi:RNAse (barnase) inhibitor barstar